MGCVTLRPICMDDAELCFGWISDPDVARFLGLLQPARTLQQERAWIARVLNDPQQETFIIEDESGLPIGTCGLRGIDRAVGTAFLGIMIGEKLRWSQGYGTEATNALLSYAFEELGLSEVRLSCHPENARALRCYEKAGFQPSGFRRERIRFGRREVRMAIDRMRWEVLQRSEETSRSKSSARRSGADRPR